MKKEAANHNRKMQQRARQKVEDRLTKKYGGTPSARKRAKAFMKGKDVHKTGRGLELISKKKHSQKYGRGNKGPSGIYKKEK